METKYYTKYKNTTIPLINEIPINWTLGRVKNILDYTHYYPIGDGDHGSIKPDMYLDKGIPYIRVQNLSWNFNINYENLVHISKKVNKENRKSILKPGDILIAKTGATVGKMAIIPQNINEANTTSSVGKITINKEKYDNKYFAYLFLSFIFRQQIIETAFQKSAQPGFNIDDLIEFKILIPPKNEQEQIAKYLDTKTTKIEQTITKNKQLITLLKEKRTTLINQTVTKGLNPDIPMKESGIEWIGKIPENWEIIRAKFLFKQRTDKGNNIQLQLLSSTQKFGVIPQELYEELSGMSAVKVKEDNDLSSFKCIHKNDYCISLRSFEGGFEFCEYEGVVSPAYSVFYPNLKINKIYYKYLFKEYCFIDNMKSYCMSLRDGKNISFENFANSYIPYPPLETQNKIGKLLDNKIKVIDKTIEKIEKNIELLEEYKESLIHHVVTGKIDVRGVEV